MPHTADTLAAAAAAPAEWEGRILAVSGHVARFRPGPQGKPIVDLVVRGSGGTSRRLRVSLLITPDEGDLTVGSEVRVMGYLSPVDPDDPFLAPDDGPIHLLGIEIVFTESKQGACLPAGYQMCEEWLQGRVPAPRQ